MEIISENKMFEGVQGVYRHKSSILKCDMTFAVFMPSLLKDKQIPVLWFLSGLTCTHENAMLKAGAQKFAQEHNIAVIFPDTSPRGTNIPDDDAYDLGQGAGFYLNATQSPWKENYKMWDYLVLELPSLIEKNFSYTEWLNPNKEVYSKMFFDKTNDPNENINQVDNPFYKEKISKMEENLKNSLGKNFWNKPTWSY